jgi:DNA primase
MKKGGAATDRWKAAREVSIAAIAGRAGIKLKSGSNRCPFPTHPDKRASFLYNQNRNSFICFGCNIRGSSIDFVMALEGSDASSAAKAILGRSELSRLPVKKVAAEEAAAEHEADPDLYSAFMAQCPLQKAGLNYMDARAITRQTLNNFRIGQLTNRTDLLKKLQLQFGLERVIRSGVVSVGKYGPYIVFPEGAIIFPFWNGMTCHYLQARTINTEKGAARWFGLKGVGKQPFNAQAFDKNPVYICEGITDVLSAWELGINAVGLLGAAQSLPKTTLSLLGSKSVYIIKDNDLAGKRMADSLSSQLTRYGISHVVQSVPQGKDLNEFLIYRRGGHGKKL